jgi:hypothetical protein
VPPTARGSGVIAVPSGAVLVDRSIALMFEKELTVAWVSSLPINGRSVFASFTIWNSMPLVSPASKRSTIYTSWN